MCLAATQPAAWQVPHVVSSALHSGKLHGPSSRMTSLPDTVTPWTNDESPFATRGDFMIASQAGATCVSER